MALTTAFARNGNRKAVPQTTADGSVSYEQGFGNLYALPPEEGGLFIDRAQFNQIMYDTTSAVISNQTSINTLNSKVTANTNSINTLNSKVADIESGVSTGVVNLTGNQTIGGVKTFSSPPVSATNPTNNNQVANKAYVDSVGNTAVKLTGNQTIAGTKTFSSPVVVPNATANTHAVNLAQLNTKANWNAVVNLTGNQTIAGAKTFTSNITAPNITAMQNNLNTIFSSTTSPVKSQTTVKTITVGTSGDFTDLLSAIAEARKYTSIVTIKLISNLSITGNIHIQNLNGTHININFNDFKIINTSSDVPFSLILNQSSFGNIIKLNLQGYQLSVINNSSVLLTESVAINNKQYADCIRCWFGSTVAIAEDTTMTLSHSNGRSSIYSSVGSIIAIGGNSTITDSSASGTVLNAYRGGIIDATTVTINSTIPIAVQAANTLTANGIIFGSYSL